MRRAFNDVGWHKFIFEIRKIINGTERESISHEMDHVKDFGKYKLALEIEWNNKTSLECQLGKINQMASELHDLAEKIKPH